MIIDKNGTLSEVFVSLQETILPDYAIEVGAHKAEFSSEMADRFEVKATAFEAGLDVFSRYKDRISSDLVSYVNAAIFDVDGTVTFNVNVNEFIGNSSIKKRNGAEPIKSVDVAAYKLDTYFKDYNFSNACLWIDVEGANKEVLLGGTETLKKVSSIFIETEDQDFWEDQWLTEDVVSFLDSNGFKKVAEENVYTAQKNIIFVKKEIQVDYKTS
jgi:FkbM family methyltransferase